ncbi:DeoR/GlpR family DNA-binding transcription regulator [Paenibacillus daejeonensis]|uniref:DeoR/GlpR family DNA-binding transcription regulator n=1 Tax=Paenibacillus daejeonensis TaxID=135193 RepID=UPI00036079A4|nr:DeoR/GlpR family DNA-binding transcription regulator [Paenibacillus daejeonensis]
MDRTTDPLFAEERKAAIVNWVNEKKKVLVPDLITRFNVSPATIRGDLRDLEAAGLIKRTHGGAIPSDYGKVGFEADHQSKHVSDLKEKREIAQTAAKLIDDGDIIILDTGTTTLELARLLRDRRNLTVIVNDLEIARCLEPYEGVQVVLIGGSLRKSFHCTVGPFATNMLAELNVDKVFLGTNAFSATKGCTTPDIHQAELKKMMVQVATQTFVLCDSSKLGKNSFVQFAAPEQIDLLITDSRITPEQSAELNEADIELTLA